MWSLLDIAPLAAVLVVLVLSAAALASALVRAALPDPPPTLRLVHGSGESAGPPTEPRLRAV
jgi:hypothetical protein